MPSVAERLTKIETKLDYITQQLDDISKNHLPHIWQRLEALEKCNAVNKSWARFIKPLVLCFISAGFGGLLTYFIFKVCGA